MIPAIGLRSLRTARLHSGNRDSGTHRGVRTTHGPTVLRDRRADRRLTPADGGCRAPTLNAAVICTIANNELARMRIVRGRASLPRTSVIAAAMLAMLVDSLRPLMHETTYCLATRHCRRTFCAGPADSRLSTPQHDPSLVTRHNHKAMLGHLHASDVPGLSHLSSGTPAWPKGWARESLPHLAHASATFLTPNQQGARSRLRSTAPLEHNTTRR